VNLDVPTPPQHKNVKTFNFILFLSERHYSFKYTFDTKHMIMVSSLNCFSRVKPPNDAFCLQNICWKQIIKAKNNIFWIMLLSLAKNRIVKTRTNGKGNHCFMYFLAGRKPNLANIRNPGSFFFLGC